MAERKRLLLIINPCSGRVRIRTHLLEVLDIFMKEGWRVQVFVTQKPLDARDIAAREGRHSDLIVCCGGDGTLNETVSGMMTLERRPALGYIPSGSTNDFAAGLKLPKRVPDAARVAVTGDRFPIDIGAFCDDRYFVYVAGFGIFTEISYATPQERKNKLGRQAYLLESLKSLASIQSYAMHAEWEGGELEGEFIFGMVTNARSVGGFRGIVTQEVALDDGLYEVLLVRMPGTPLELSTMVSDLFSREPSSNDMIYRFRTNAISFTSGNPVDWVLDGEFGGSRTEVRIENLQRQIAIRKGQSKKSSKK